MNDDSTNVLGQQQVPDDETRVLPRAPVPSSGGKPVSAKGKKPWWLTLIWALVRLGTIGVSLLLTAQLAAEYLSAPVVQWIVALIGALVVPSTLYALLRRTVKKRSPKARFKLAWLTWSFGWGGVLATLIWVNLPGIGSMAVGVQGANLARGLVEATSPDHVAPGAVVWISGVVMHVTEAIESGIFGEEPTRERRQAGEQALQAFLSGSGGEGQGPHGTETAATEVAAAPARVEPGEAAEGVGTGVGNQSATGTSAASGGESVPAGGVPAATRENSPASGLQNGQKPDGTMPVPLPGKAGTEPQPAVSAKHTVVEVPFEQEGGNLLIDVVLNRRFPARLRIDSTATYTTLDGTTLRRMGITPEAGAPTVTIDTPVGPQTDVVLTLDTIAVGGLEVVGPTIMRCNDCRTLSYQGILGYNVLSNFQMSIDNTQSVLLFSDRRDTADRREDIKPFVVLRADPKPGDGPNQPFVVTAANHAHLEIGTLFARLTLMDDKRLPVGSQDIKLPPVPPGGTVSAKVDVPRTPPFTYFAVDLGTARW